MEKYQVTTGVFWVSIPEVGLQILCGCPSDVVKHCMKRGFIVAKEKDGVTFETGPNAILLSDSSIQNGYFSNLAEFPFLQMFYRQGMLLPNHPNNTGAKPLLIGLEDQVRSQMDYIYRGNYGLVTKEEMTAAGATEAEAEEMLRLKLRFAFDRIRDSQELIDPRIIDRDIIELRDNVYIRRCGLNRYQFIYGNETTTVDLNLQKNERYKPPYNLGLYKLKRQYFSVVHIGEGDGWDPSRPCMASMIVFQGKIYLIDAGPDIMDSLVALGFCMNEIEGIFHTHAHDDHFAGLPTLIRSGHRLKYYATPLVRASVTKKIAALLSMEEERFGDYFEIHDLDFDVWNDIQGLEVKPVYSAHPVETSILFFRAYWDGGYRSYAHFADIAAFNVLESMVTSDPEKSGLSKERLNRFKQDYLEPATIKKLDIGGGLIHGDAEDFINDESGRLLLSHTADPLTNRQKEIGSNATFGMQDILIKGLQDYSISYVFHQLETYFPNVDQEGLKMLLNCPDITINPGTIIIKQGDPIDHIYLVVNGVVELIDSEHEVDTVISPGYLIGEIGGMLNKPAKVTYRAGSYIRTVKIPVDIYRWFVEKYNLVEETKRISVNRGLLRFTWLFGESLPSPIENRLAKAMQLVEWEAGTVVNPTGGKRIYILFEGKGHICSYTQTVVDDLGYGDFFGEDSIITGATCMFTFRAEERTKAGILSADLMQDIPIVQWKLFETFDRRMKIVKSRFQIKWYESYCVGIKEIDKQHKKLFTLLADVFRIRDEKGDMQKYRREMNTFLEHLKSHLEYEENLMSSVDYGRYNYQKEEHKTIVELMREYTRKADHTAEEEHYYTEKLKEWLLTHTLIEDRKYMHFFHEKGID